MTIADDKLKTFFSSQKVGAFDALKQKGKVSTPQNNAIGSTKSLPDKASISDSVVVPNRPHINKSASSTHDLLEKKEKKPLAYSEQITSKPHSNRELTVSMPLALNEQSVSNTELNQYQNVSAELAEPLAKGNEPRSFLDADLHLNLYSKRERELLNHIFWECHNNASLFTRVIGTDELLDAMKISPVRLRNLIFRIQKKGGVTIRMSKIGRGACRSFELSRYLYQNIAEDVKRKQNNPINSLAKPLANISISNSSYINNNTITTDLDPEWRKIDIEQLRHIGFSETQLKQLVGKNSSQVVQESIFHFSFGLENNPKTKQYQTEGKDPLNILMGVLRKGQSWFEKDYRSAQELAQEKLLEQKKGERERLKKLEEQTYQIALDEWVDSLKPRELERIAPDNNKINQTPKKVMLSLYFKENVWPEIKTDYLVMAEIE